MKEHYIKILKYVVKEENLSAMEIQLHCTQERMACISVKTTDIHIYHFKNLYSTSERLKEKHLTLQTRINPVSTDMTQRLIIINV